MNISDESRETKQSQQREEFDESKDFDRSTGASDAVATGVIARVEEQKDVVDGQRAEQIDHEPGFDVVHGDETRLENDLVDVIVSQHASTNERR